MKLTHACDCKECNHGCNFGSGFFVEGEKEKLAKFFKITEKELEEKYLEEVDQFNTKLFKPKLSGKPYGKCVFFENNKCKIHDAKPLQCKLAMGCKDYGEDLMIWFMENYQVDENNESSMKQYEVYLKSGGKKLK